MSHFGDFMDGVPVKISEKYKKPPSIELPYTLIECPIRAQNVVDNVKYCSSFESNVLIKVKELRRIKETKKNERKHRLQLLEEAKQKKLDAIALAEEKERLKQLNVSEVSYPSTDEINPLTSDEKNEINCDSNIGDTKETAEVSITDINIIPATTANESQNILQPTLVKFNYEGSLLDDPDPLETYKLNAKVSKIQYNHNIDTLTYRDFENDTSSPFDNVELKTINDMELLAQVLQSQKESVVSCSQQPHLIEQGYGVPNCASQAQIGISYLPNSYVEQPTQEQGLVYTHHYPSNYYAPELDNANVPQNYQYNASPNLYTVPNYYSNQVISADIKVSNDAQCSSQPYYYQYSPAQYQLGYKPNEIEEHSPQNPIKTETCKVEELPSSQIVKSRSRSVPDIVKELNEELAKFKMNDRSYNVSPAPANIPQPSSSKQKKSERRRKKSEHLPNPYDKLPPKLQGMCQRIHGMGFSLDRVVRVCTLVGENDKKVIECLLVVGEMMDLGFSEASVLSALAKHDFNRDKAIDELVT